MKKLMPAALLIAALSTLFTCSFPLNEPKALAKNPLPAPASVSAITQTTTSITVSWSAVADARTYTIYRSLEGGEFEQIKSQAYTAYTDNTVSANNVYYYCVSASADNRGESSPSSSASAATKIPETPTGVTTLVQSATSIEIDWTASPGATEYYVYRDSVKLSTPTISGNSYTDTTVTNNNDYIYTVSSVNILGESAQSSSVSASTKEPVAPTGLAAAVASATSISLSWDATPNAASYKIYRATASGGPYTTPIGTSATNSYSDASISAGYDYYYTVSAVNVIGEGPQSTEIMKRPRTIIYYANGASGTPPAAETVESGSNINIPNKRGLYYIGKYFDGWNTEANGSGVSYSTGAVIALNANMALYAQWLTVYAIGDVGPAGGIIFYYNSSGFTSGGSTCYYLEAAPADLPGTYQWGGDGTLCTTGTNIGTGATNTSALEGHDHGTPTYGVGVHQAAKACADYGNGTAYDDWFLPSKYELAQLYAQKAAVGISSGRYWSSSNSGQYAWYLNCDDGGQYGGIKYNSFYVRAVRAF